MVHHLKHDRRSFRNSTKKLGKHAVELSKKETGGYDSKRRGAKITQSEPTYDTDVDVANCEGGEPNVPRRTKNVRGEH